MTRMFPPGVDLGLMVEEGTLNILITYSTIDAADGKALLVHPPPGDFLH